VSFAAITLCVASERVFVVVSIYFVIDSVRKLLDTPSYTLLFSVGTFYELFPWLDPSVSFAMRTEILDRFKTPSPESL
jgi:hypothetical protein